MGDRIPQAFLIDIQKQKHEYFPHHWATERFCYRLFSVVTNVVFTLFWFKERKASVSFISPRLTTPASPSRTVRIEVNVSVWNEMLPVSGGRCLLCGVRHSSTNNIGAYKDLLHGRWPWSEIKILQNLFENLLNNHTICLCAWLKPRLLILISDNIWTLICRLPVWTYLT